VRFPAQRVLLVITPMGFGRGPHALIALFNIAAYVEFGTKSSWQILLPLGFVFAYFFRSQKVVIIIVLGIQERDNLTFKSPLSLVIIVESLLYFCKTLHAKSGRYGHKIPF
jgi:hypothetical protein